MSNLPSKTILTNVVDIVSGPYAGMTGELKYPATSDSTYDRGSVQLDPEFRFDLKPEVIEVDGVWHVLSYDNRTVYSVWVRLSEYRRLTEFEMVERYNPGFFEDQK